MVVKTQVTSPVAEKAQQGNIEFLLANHPLDCPVCDKGGECPLQNQAMSHGPGETRFTEHKRTFAKPVQISAQVLLDRERCVLCARCTRFSEQIAGDPFIECSSGGPAAGRHRRGRAVPLVLLRQHHPDLPGRGPHQRGLPVPVASVRPRFDAVGRRARLVGPAIRVDHRRGKVMRRLAGDDPRSTRSGSATRTASLHVDGQDDRLTTRWSATRTASSSLPRGRVRWPSLPAGWRRRASCAARGRLTLKTPSPTVSPAPCCAPTTSTSAPACTPPRRPTSWLRRSPPPT